MKKNSLLLFLPTLVSVAILLPASLTPNLFIFKPFGWDEVGQLLAFLILISLFLERALEVFITTWRGSQGEKLDNNVQACERKIAELKTLIETELQQPETVAKTELSQRLGDLEKFNLDRAEYKS